MRNLAACLISVSLTLGVAACSSSDSVLHPKDGGTGGTGGAGTGTATGGTGTGTGSGGAGGGIATGSSACSDGKDNDGDGKIDYEDPECVGPTDNDEGSFAT